MVANERASGSETTGAEYVGGATEHAASPDESEVKGHQNSTESASTPAQEQPASVKAQTRRIVEEQKTAAADRIDSVAEATERAAGNLAREVPQAAQALHAMAERLDSAASALRERSIDDWISGAWDFARQQPFAFFAGAVATGFALSRFLKSSSPGPHGHR